MRFCSAQTHAYMSRHARQAPFTLIRVATGLR